MSQGQLVAVLVLAVATLAVGVVCLGIRLSTPHVRQGRPILYVLIGFGIWGIVKLCSLAFLVLTCTSLR